ncbi:glycosyltransferase family 1 protein [Hydrogenobacter thermophilus]|uniref:glycosyltransferase family 4 protein n=1 Tax=Hydrogenobacter thermophilus TaxID=940 RepID=UPI0030F6A9D2
MKLFINATHFYNAPSGLGVYTQNIVKALLNKYKDVKVFTGNKDVGACGYCSIVITPKCINPRRGTSGHILRILWEQSYLWLITLKEKPDILFSTVHEGVALPISGTKQIITIHDLIAIKFPHYFKRLKYYFIHFLPIIIKNSRALICVSESTKRDLFNHYKLKDKSVYVIYPGYDRSIFFPREKKLFKDLGRYFLFVGDMRPHKNLDRLIQAVGELKQYNFKLLIAGKKDKRFYPALSNKVKEYGLEGKVVFLDYVPTEELPYLYSRAEALVFPSLYEGFGLPLIEAMACGCPVITSDIPPLREVCGESAYYVNPYHKDSIAEGIYRLFMDHTLKSKLATMGIERAKMFSWERSADEHVRVFEEITRGHYQQKP